MKIFIISDTHFGVYPLRSDRWLNMAMEWRDSFLLPTLKKYAKPGDRIVHLGDVYDNRTSINVRVLNKTVETFEMIADILPLDVLIGNHDMWAMSDTSINSVVSVKNIKNVNIYTKPTTVQHGSKSCLYMPWIYDKENSVNSLRSNKADVLFCHSDMQGCRTQVTPTRPFNREIPKAADYANYGKVYSGHIHIRQDLGNLTFVGAPYHMDRNDLGNQKGMYVYDTEKNLDTFIPNTVSPEFTKVIVESQSDLPGLIDALTTGNYVDVKVAQTLLISEPGFKTALDRILSEYNVESMEWIADVTTNIGEGFDEHDSEDINKGLDINIEQMSREWGLSRTYSDTPDTDTKIKERLVTVLDKAFTVLKSAASK